MWKRTKSAYHVFFFETQILKCSETRGLWNVKNENRKLLCFVVITFSVVVAFFAIDWNFSYYAIRRIEFAKVLSCVWFSQIRQRTITKKRFCTLGRRGGVKVVETSGRLGFDERKERRRAFEENSVILATVGFPYWYVVGLLLFFLSGEWTLRRVEITVVRRRDDRVEQIDW